ncbi:hypothetical protein OAG36_01105 [bacterium]|nr:hypothetical protein [bacterium]
MHTYKEYEKEDATLKVIQHHATGRVRRVDENHPDYLAALAEQGKPRITRIAYVAPTPPTDAEIAAQNLRQFSIRQAALIVEVFKQLAQNGALTPANLSDESKETFQDMQAYLTDYQA